MDEHTLKKALEGIRAAFPGRCYVGGSYARHVCLGSQYDYDDIDIFITGPRMMEYWMLELILQEIFDTTGRVIEPHPDNPPDLNEKQYFISTQFARVVCKRGNITFDLIFVDSSIDDIIVKQTASSYSKMYYEISYHPDQMLRIVSNPAITEAVTNIIINKRCDIVRSICSSSHYEKIERLCRKHGVTLRPVPPYVSPKPFFDSSEDDDIERQDALLDGMGR